MAQLPQIPQIKNGKPDFSPTFQKVELRNSTFFQQVSPVGYLLNHSKFVLYRELALFMSVGG